MPADYNRNISDNFVEDGSPNFGGIVSTLTGLLHYNDQLTCLSRRLGIGQVQRVSVRSDSEEVPVTCFYGNSGGLALVFTFYKRK